MKLSMKALPNFHELVICEAVTRNGEVIDKALKLASSKIWLANLIDQAPLCRDSSKFYDYPEVIGDDSCAYIEIEI